MRKTLLYLDYSYIYFYLSITLLIRRGKIYGIVFHFLSNNGLLIYWIVLPYIFWIVMYAYERKKRINRGRVVKVHRVLSGLVPLPFVMMAIYLILSGGPA